MPHANNNFLFCNLKSRDVVILLLGYYFPPVCALPNERDRCTVRKTALCLSDDYGVLLCHIEHLLNMFNTIVVYNHNISFCVFMFT